MIWWKIWNFHNWLQNLQFHLKDTVKVRLIIAWFSIDRHVIIDFKEILGDGGWVTQCGKSQKFTLTWKNYVKWIHVTIWFISDQFDFTKLFQKKITRVKFPNFHTVWGESSRRKTQWGRVHKSLDISSIIIFKCLMPE